MAKLVIRGGTVIDPANTLEGKRDILITDGRIQAVQKMGSFSGVEGVSRQIDARGLLVVPGLVDMHTHLREPGFEYKETILTGTQAAVAGGFTSVACMANTQPVNDNGAVTRYIAERAKTAQLAHVFPIGAVSLGLRGEALAEIGEMVEAGVVAVSDDGQPLMDSELMRRALEYCRLFGIPIISHAEDLHLSRNGLVNEGLMSVRLGLRGIPNAAEDVMVARDIALAALTGGRLHIAHVSTRGAVALIRRAKEEGLPVTAEVTPHHFSLTDEAVEGFNTQAKTKPPLRSIADAKAITAGLGDGTIDAIATDHAPHHRDEKEVEFEQAAWGVVGLETALPLALKLVDEGILPLTEAVRKLTQNPSHILGISRGTLSPGAVADVTLIDPEKKWRVVAAQFRSKGKNSPFDGWEMKGKAVMTMVEGRIVYDELANGKSIPTTQ